MDFVDAGGQSTRPRRGDLGDPDGEQLRYAVENNWILLTFDDDFLSLVECQEFGHVIALCSTGWTSDRRCRESRR